MTWHAKNLFLHMLFEQGAIGLTLFSAVLVAGFARIIRPTMGGHRGAIALGAALAGFMVVGLFDSHLDVPRLLLLLYLLVFASTLFPRRLLFDMVSNDGRRLQPG